MWYEGPTHMIKIVPIRSKFFLNAHSKISKNNKKKGVNKIENQGGNWYKILQIGQMTGTILVKLSL